MSLINQMLRDLEVRQSQHGRDAQPLPPGLAEGGGLRARRRPWPAILLVAGFIGLGAVVALALKSHELAEPNLPVVAAHAPADAAVPADDEAVVEPQLEPSAEPPLQPLGLRAESTDATLTLKVAGIGTAPVLRQDGRAGEIFVAGAAPPATGSALEDARLSDWQVVADAGGTRLRYSAAAGVEVTVIEDAAALTLRFIEPEPAPVPDAVAVSAQPVAVATPDSKPDAEPPVKVDSGTVAKRAVQLSPGERADNHYRDALAALERGDTAAAEQSLQEAMALVPGHGEARRTLASLLIGTGRATEGEALLISGITREPADARLRMLLARSQIARGDVAAAIAVLESGTDHLVPAADYRAFLAALYQRISRHDAAIEQYHAALSANPAVPAWWAGLGISLEAAGRSGEAAQAYRRALSLPGLGGGLQQYIRERLAVIG